MRFARRIALICLAVLFAQRAAFGSQDAGFQVLDADFPGASSAAGSTIGQILQSVQWTLRAGEIKTISGVEGFENSDPQVAACQPGDNSNLIVTGKRPGKTQILIKKKDYAGYFKYLVDVQGITGPDLHSKVKSALGGIVGLKIRMAGEIVELEGRILRRNDGLRIDRQLALYESAILDMTDRLYLDEDLAQMKAAFAREGFNASPSVENSPQGFQRLVLAGKVASGRQNERVEQIARQYFVHERIVNQVVVDHPLLQVSIETYSIDCNRARKTGDNILRQITTVQSSGWTFNTGPNSSTDYPQISVGALRTLLNASLLNGTASQESAQTIQVREGETGKVQMVKSKLFTIATADTADVKEISAGLILSVKPIILDDGRFETRVEAEASSFDKTGTDANDKAAGGKEINSIATTFVSRQGETVLLGGSSSHATSVDHDRTPVLGWIPIVNLFFKKTDKSSAATKHVTVMTIYSPQSVDPHAQPIDAAGVERDVRREGASRRGRLERTR